MWNLVKETQVPQEYAVKSRAVKGSKNGKTAKTMNKPIEDNADASDGDDESSDSEDLKTAKRRSSKLKTSQGKLSEMYGRIQKKAVGNRSATPETKDGRKLTMDPIAQLPETNIITQVLPSRKKKDKTLQKKVDLSKKCNLTVTERALE